MWELVAYHYQLCCTKQGVQAQWALQNVRVSNSQNHDRWTPSSITHFSIKLASIIEDDFETLLNVAIKSSSRYLDCVYLYVPKNEMNYQ